MPERQGWGHSTYEEVVALAEKAGVHNLLLTHHDPGRTDAEVEKIVELARRLAAGSRTTRTISTPPGKEPVTGCPETLPLAGCHLCLGP